MPRLTKTVHLDFKESINIGVVEPHCFDNIISYKYAVTTAWIIFHQLYHRLE